MSKGGGGRKSKKRKGTRYQNKMAEKHHDWVARKEAQDMWQEWRRRRVQCTELHLVPKSRT